MQPDDGFARDAAALAGDWRRVGDDMRRAIRRVAEEEGVDVAPFGDGDPREYGGRLADGRLWVHPPYGPAQVCRPLFGPPPPRSWRARLARWWARWMR